jgi:hypothetical protein
MNLLINHNPLDSKNNLTPSAVYRQPFFYCRSPLAVSPSFIPPFAVCR